MELYTGTGLKLKRKDLDEVNDDFSDFSLSSPARKIRRLDAELPPIIEEEEAEISLGYRHSVSHGAILNGAGEEFKALDIEELPFVSEDEEKAIVPFNPMNGLLHSATKYSVDPNLISCFKNQAILGSHLNTVRPSEEDEPGRNGDNREVNTCRAVIPWIPSQHLDQRPPVLSSQTQASESMDAEEMEEATMEIESDSIPDAGQHVSGYINHPSIGGCFQHQWQQQHCMIPQPPQNVTTPLVWYR